MIVVKVELHSAITGQVTKIGEAVIFNDMTGNAKRGNYGARVFRKPNFFQYEKGGLEKNVTRRSDVKNYDRNGRPIWDLVTLALKNMGYGK